MKPVMKNHHKRNHIWHEKTPFLHFFGTHRIQYIWRIVLSLYFLDSKSFSWKIHKLIYNQQTADALIQNVITTMCI